LKSLTTIFGNHFGHCPADFFQGERVRRRIPTGEGINGVQVHPLENLPYRRSEERADIFGKHIFIIPHRFLGKFEMTIISTYPPV
jgi:hypothetical protein